MSIRRGFVPPSALVLLVLLLLPSSSSYATVCSGPDYFAPATTVVTGSNPTYVATGDFNADGFIDLAVANSFGLVSGGAGSSIAILLGHGDGTFQAPVNYLAGQRPRSIVTGDYNGDGITDLAVANQGNPYVSILIGLGTGAVGNGTFASPVNYPAGAAPFHIRRGDFNEDGIADLVVSNNAAPTISVLLGQGSGGIGNGTFAGPVSYALQQLSTGLAIGDFNSDGIADLAATENYGGTIAIFLGQGSGGVGNGTFASAVHYAAGAEPFDITVHDFDGDGISDLAVANTNSGGVALLRGNGSGGVGNGTFASPSILSSGNSAQAVPADVNHDGITDLLVSLASAAPAYIRVYLGQGTGVLSPAEFGSPSNYPVGGDPIQTALGDFNADGAVDLAVPNYFDNAISLLPGACGADPRAPVLTRVRDVPNDEGGKVFLTWTRSSLDVSGGAVTNYRVWRRIPPEAAQELMARADGRETGTLITSRQRDAVTSDPIVYWEALATLPAQRLAGYGYTAATTQDSMPHYNPYTAFFVTALTNNIDVFYESNVDSGYSVDNLPPHQPGHFVAQPQTGVAVALHWDANTETDVIGYRLYRGSTPDFVPTPEALISAQADTGYVDPAGSGYCYKLMAVDQHENQSLPASLDVQSIVGVGQVPLSLALEGARPNPSPRGEMAVWLTLPDATPARLMVLDMAGRQVASRWVSGAGRRSVVLATEGQLPAGVYLVRLVQGRTALQSKAVVIK